jgi:diaminopropionate ammonia-lyase
MHEFPATLARLTANRRSDRGRSYGEAERAILSLARHSQVRGEIESWPGYRPTPLRPLHGLAGRAGLGAIYYKDESGRFGLKSFKALGGAYGVQSVLAREVSRRTGGDEVSGRDFISSHYTDVVSILVVTCATAGNHGRSVAWGAEMFGCRCAIYVPAVTVEARVAAIAEHGAVVVRTSGNYDEAVRRCDDDARRQGRFVVSDTSYPGYTEVPRDVMQGYSVMVAEIMEQLPEAEQPTHVFVQGGVGGLAATVCAHLWEAWGEERPILSVVEPDSANCLFRSAEAGRPTPVPSDYHTIMAGLAAGEVSPVAWKILKHGADYFMTIPDAAAEAAMRLLADGIAGDPRIVAGESGAAGLAGALAAVNTGRARDELSLRSDSRVLVIGTEGATDPDGYSRIVGCSPELVTSPSSDGT